MNPNRSSVALLIAIVITLVSVSAAYTASQQPRPQAAASPLGAGFTYQGQLRRGGSPANATCDFQFSLWDSAIGGVQQGSTQSKTGINVVNGLFTVLLDFGNQFTGPARWLQTAVKCSGDGGFTTLSPRQSLSAAPYALSVRPGARIEGAIDSGATSEAGLRVTNSSTNYPIGVSGIVTATTGPAIGVAGNNSSSGGYAVFGYSTNGGLGVFGQSPSGVGVRGSGGTRAGVLGTTSDLSGSGVEGNASGSNAAGVFGLNTSGPGVWGRGTAGGSGVFGQSNGYAVYGASAGGFGVYGTSSNGGVVGVGYVGVQGNANGTTDSQGVRGDNGGSNTVGYAGLFNGRVSVFGNLNVYGTLAKSAGSFKIDHPLDPAHKYLSHSFVESPDMKNIYDGVTTLGADGTVVVKLPDYFEALNMEFRYQLTCIGGYAPVYIAEEIAGNQFKIAGGTAGLKVSWQVTGTRHDPYANQNRIQVEEDKPAKERGRYLYPTGYGQPASRGLTFLQPASDPTANAQPMRPGDAATQSDGER
jgi:hypothetical protein